MSRAQGRRARCCASTSRTGSTARAARGRSRTTRSRLEFCENGAKAVAEEATDRTGHRRLLRRPLDRRARRPLRLLARPAGPPHRADAPGARRHALPADLAGTTPSPLVGDRLRSLASPDRAVFYTSGRTSNEAAFLYQLFVRAFGTNNLPDCSNMCHESSGVALGETIGIGKGTVTLDDVHAAELILVVGQNPGTNHPRMLSALEQAKRNGAAIVADQPAARGRADRLPQPAAAPRPRRTRHGARRPPPAGRRRRRPRPVPVGQPAPRSSAAPSTGRSSTHTATGFAELAAHLGALDADALLAATGLDAAAAEAFVDRVAAATRIVACWAMGLTQHRQAVATIREIVNTRAAARLDRAPRRRAVPGARAQQRAGRPHDGHRRTSVGARCSTPSPARFAFDPPRHHGYDTVGDDRGDGGRRRRRVRRARRQLRRGGAGHRRDRGGARALRADRAGVDEAQPLARPLRRGGADPAVPRAHRSRRPTPEPASSRSRTRWASSTPRRGGNEPASPHLRSEVEIVCAVAAATLGDRPDRLGRSRRRLRRDPRPHRGDDPGVRRLQRARAPPGRLRPAQPAARQHARSRRRRGTARPDGQPRSSRSPCRPGGCCCRRCARTTSSTRRSTASTTATAACPAAGGWCSCNPADVADARPRRRRPRRHRQRVDATAASAGPAGFRVVAYPTARGCCAAYFPEANVLVPLDSVAEGSRTPTSKAIVVRLERPPATGRHGDRQVDRGDARQVIRRSVSCVVIRGGDEPRGSPRRATRPAVAPRPRRPRRPRLDLCRRIATAHRGAAEVVQVAEPRPQHRGEVAGLARARPAGDIHRLARPRRRRSGR